MVVVLLVLLCLIQTVPGAPPKLTNENGAKASLKNGILELRGGSGWLRTPRPLLDFEVKFEIRALTPDADPGLIVRTWRGWERWPDVGYRLMIPTTTGVDVSHLLIGRRQNLRVIQQGTLDLRPPGEWQQVQVNGQGNRIRLAVNNILVCDFAVEHYGGYLMIDNRKGRVEFRNITLRSSELNEAIPPDVLTDEQLKASGGQEPKVLHEVKPIYTPEAMRGVIQGVVVIEAMVLADGSVGPVRVTRGLDADLDVSAVAALKAWRFRPAVVNGSPVPIVVKVEMSFTLK